MAYGVSVRITRQLEGLCVPETPRPPRIVFLSQRVPYPPDRGDRITTWNFLRHFLERGAEVAVGCLQEEPRDADAVDFLRAQCREVVAPRRSPRVARALGLRGLLTGEPLTLPVFRQWCAPTPPDVIWVYSSSMAQYALGVPARAKVMQFAELDSDKWRQYAVNAGPLGRWIYGREARLLLAFEDRVARAFDRSLVVSEVERDLFRQRIAGVEPAVLPNGVDVGHFQSRGDGDRHARTAIFTGVMDYEPNVDGVCWFVAACWPALRERFPDAQLLVVGSRPSPRVTALARMPGVTVTGRVPETPPWFDRAAVAIAPLRLARGVQNKVLEALSMGLPVVSTSHAAQGLGPAPTAALAVADDAAATTAAVARWFADPALARASGTAGATWVRQTWRWEAMHAQCDALLAGLGVRWPQ
jgi:sugar transferase (PEP-CTERM/EpsH1 system associated)